MNTLLILAFLGASWEPPPPKVAQVLEVAPALDKGSGCVGDKPEESRE